jgi:alpha-ketoglutarate-dependent taurine dioxygenase
LLRLASRLLTDLSRQGWAVVQFERGNSLPRERQLLELATTLGPPQPTRGRALVDHLTPHNEDRAHPKSLSASAGLAVQPWHIDLAHRHVPARYIALVCEREGARPVPTELVPWRRVVRTADHEAGHAEPFLVRTGRGSFYATLLTQGQRFLRFDPGCMQPMTRGASVLMSRICDRKIDPAVRIDWRPGLATVIDNWRMLHRRQDAHGAEDRVLLTASVMGDNTR